MVNGDLSTFVMVEDVDIGSATASTPTWWVWCLRRMAANRIAEPWPWGGDDLVTSSTLCNAYNILHSRFPFCVSDT